jgi:hypothetical protein
MQLATDYTQRTMDRAAMTWDWPEGAEGRGSPPRIVARGLQSYLREM